MALKFARNLARQCLELRVRDRDMRSSRYESATGAHMLFEERVVKKETLRRHWRCRLQIRVSEWKKSTVVEDVTQQSAANVNVANARHSDARLMRAINRGFVWPSGRQTEHWRADTQSGGAVAARRIAEVAAAPASNSQLRISMGNFSTRNYEELWGTVERAAGSGRCIAGGALVRTWEGHTSSWRNWRSTSDRSHFKALLWSCASERDATSLAHAHAKLKAGYSLPQCALHVSLKWIPVCHSIPTAPSSTSKGAVLKCILEICLIKFTYKKDDTEGQRARNRSALRSTYVFVLHMCTITVIVLVVSLAKATTRSLVIHGYMQMCHGGRHARIDTQRPPCARRAAGLCRLCHLCLTRFS